MISAEQLDVLPEYLIKLWESLESEFLKKIANNMRVKDAEQLLKLGFNKDELAKKLQDTYKKSSKEVEALFDKATKYSWSQDKDIADKLSKELPPLDTQLINAQINQMREQFKNITNTTGFIVDNKFVRLPDVLDKVSSNAYMQVVTGGSSIDSAINKQMVSLCERGLVWVEYASGIRRRVETTIRMSVITGINQTVSQITDKNAEALDAEYFEVSAHIGARNTGEGWENHERWQGKHGDRKWLHDICGYGEMLGLEGINCRHSHYPFFPGITEPKYTDEQLRNMRGEPFDFHGKHYNGTYEASQEMRRMEQNIKRLKREEASGIPNAYARRQEQMRIYNEFAKVSGLPTQYERTRTYNI